MKKKVIAAILIIAAVVCGAVAFFHFHQEQTAGSEYEALKQDVLEEPAGPDTPVTETPAAEETGWQNPIDFAALQAKCPDAYAWIHIDDTNIDYPIVQHPTDDTYYLNHSAEGGSSRAGAVYTESLNTKTFMDPNTVIYGHNMKNGSMFRTLHNFEDRDFFNSHPEVVIYTPDSELHYQIFAAYRTDNNHILKSNDFSNPFAFASYLEGIKMQKSMSAFIRDDVAVTADNYIITLSTCTGDDSSRYLVQAVLTSSINAGN